MELSISTTALTQPSDLRPRIDVAASMSRKVNLAIILRLPTLVINHIHKYTALINRTHCTPVRYAPIAVNIETKLIGT